ncbi:hypothetical protein L208DRAFT_878583 [Tricholoma matsutake]|nr:hypothetical protein L208DRAFT_878583 [Tricholoma matsutake 945]
MTQWWLLVLKICFTCFCSVMLLQSGQSAYPSASRIGSASEIVVFIHMINVQSHLHLGFVAYYRPLTRIHLFN